MDNNNDSSKEIEINILDLCYELLSKLWIIIVTAAVCGIGAFVYFNFFATPVYTAQTDVYVKVDYGESKIDTGAVSIATNIAKDYQKLMTNDIVLSEVRNELGLSAGSGLAKSIKVTSSDNTRVITVKVTYSSPELAANIANVVCEKSQSILPGYTDVEIKQLAKAEVPVSPTSPQVIKNTVIGFLVGAVISAAIIVLIRIFNDKLMSEEDIEKRLGISVLGDIPNLYDEKKKGFGYGKYGRYGKYSRYDRYQSGISQKK